MYEITIYSPVVIIYIVILMTYGILSTHYEIDQSHHIMISYPSRNEVSHTTTA